MRLNINVRRLMLVCALLWVAAAGFRAYGRRYEVPPDTADALVLLVPDTADEDDPHIQVWRDAASEEGLHLLPMRDTEFQGHASTHRHIAGVILPDQVHKVASSALLHCLDSFAHQGGEIMVVYDAATWTVGQTYAPGRSRLSSLTGVDYALYDRYGDHTIISGPVRGTVAALDALRIPPGKYAPIGDGKPALFDDPSHQEARERMCEVTGYSYGTLRYPHFVTARRYGGSVLLSSLEHHLIAGHKPYGVGGVLFVNLPLGYLKERTDGLFLHGFLHYFASEILDLPRLAAVPDAIPGQVMNWHLDSNATLKPLTDMAVLGVYRQGPYSIHITAGPDTRSPGDGLGLNVPANQAIQRQIRDMIGRGDAVGSHGGWIHDYFGRGVREDNQAVFEPYLEQNKAVLERVTGKPVLEYSAPVGNQPQWVTAWLEAHGVLAYYFAGNAGMGPTRSYRGGHLADKKIWSFPVLPYGKVACFEEMHQAGIPDERIARWCRAVTDFCVRQRVSRLVYFHPPGALLYPGAMRAWLARAAEWTKQGRFRWYTMTDLALFLNARERVTWSVSPPIGTQQIVEATHPDSLQHQAWVLPVRAYDRPVITEGEGSVRQEGKDWLVVAAEGKRLRFVASLNRPAGKSRLVER